jgi:hypothetical protein
MNVLGQAIRRSDVYDRSRLYKPEARVLDRMKSHHTNERGERVDSHGRYVGHGDIERGLRFFCSKRINNQTKES